MRSLRFRPRLDGFEDRLTPAVAAGDMMAAAAQTAAGAAFFQAIADDPDWIFNPQFQSFLQQKLQTIVQGSQSAMATFAGAGDAQWAMASATESLAIRVGDMIGINVAPVTPVVPPPTPAPTDAGMTSTMPDPNAPNWVALGSAGLKTWDVVQGSGTPVAAGDSITVFYSGWLASNGTQFDARRSPNPPATFNLNGLIQGWQQGIVGMRPGGIRRLFVPSALGYGAAGSPPNIPANADLVFEIKLVSHT